MVRHEFPAVPASRGPLDTEKTSVSNDHSSAVGDLSEADSPAKSSVQVHGTLYHPSPEVMQDAAAPTRPRLAVSALPELLTVLRELNERARLASSGPCET